MMQCATLEKLPQSDQSRSVCHAFQIFTKNTFVTHIDFVVRVGMQVFVLCMATQATLSRTMWWGVDSLTSILSLSGMGGIVFFGFSFVKLLFLQYGEL